MSIPIPSRYIIIKSSNKGMTNELIKLICKDCKGVYNKLYVNDHICIGCLEIRNSIRKVSDGLRISRSPPDCIPIIPANLSLLFGMPNKS